MMPPSNWHYCFIHRADGKVMLRQRGETEKYDKDFGPFATRDEAKEAMWRVMNPKVEYYDKAGIRLDS